MSDAAYNAFTFGPSGLQPYVVAEDTPQYGVRSWGASIGLGGLEGPELVARLRKGLPSSSFGQLQRALGVPAKVLADIVHVPVRTLSRRKQQGRFDVSESERIYRLAALFDHALDVLGSAEETREWLKNPVRGLGYKAPLSHADTEPGTREVHDMLGRIEHGVFA
jgi:putative toxin-antitoxin system antitoxin component (TIGR02293 family)